MPRLIPHLRAEGLTLLKLAFLQGGFHLVHGPAFARGDDPDLLSAADKQMRAHVIVSVLHYQLGLWLPVQGEIEVTGEDLPARAVVELDNVALGMRFDLHACAPPFTRSVAS